MGRFAILALLFAAPAFGQYPPQSGYFNPHNPGAYVPAPLPPVHRTVPLLPAPTYQSPLPPLPMLPPLGTTQCRPVFICAAPGQCVWQQVCQ